MPAFGSAFYPLFNPQIRMSADPHFTRSPALAQTGYRPIRLLYTKIM